MPNTSIKPKPGGAFSDLIFVSLEDWDEVWRRNQFLCAGFARRFPDRKILFVGLPRDVSHDLRRGRLGALRAAPVETLPDYPNVTILHPLKVFPNTLTWGRKTNEALAQTQIKRTARALGMDRPLLWLNPHSAVHMAGRMDERAVVYDITDDWISLTQKDWLRRLTAAQDAELCRRADAVIVCSQTLFDLKSSLTGNLHLVPNGVDASHYERVGDRSLPLPEAAARWPRPVLGYTGSVHPDRVDVGLVEALARKFPEGTVALVGPNMLPPVERARMDALGNVPMTGPVPYAQIPDYMRAFDVCITPHRMTPFTESLNPIKLWEYLAGGKPIVSSDVAGFRDYPTLVRLAADPDAFVAACADALREPASDAEPRRAEARKHTWDSRVERVLSILEGLGDAPQPGGASTE